VKTFLVGSLCAITFLAIGRARGLAEGQSEARKQHLIKAAANVPKDSLLAKKSRDALPPVPNPCGQHPAARREFLL
jgi:hypothetical protein